MTFSKHPAAELFAFVTLTSLAALILWRFLRRLPGVVDFYDFSILAQVRTSTKKFTVPYSWITQLERFTVSRWQSRRRSQMIPMLEGVVDYKALETYQKVKPALAWMRRKAWLWGFACGFGLSTLTYLLWGKR